MIERRPYDGPGKLEPGSLTGPSLDLKRPHRCERGDVEPGILICPRCRDNEPPGCDLVEQEGGLFGWSESNVQYELIGKRCANGGTR